MTNVLASSLAEGAHTLRVCVSDAATNTGSQTTSVTKDTIAARMGGSISYTDGWFTTASVPVTFTNGTDSGSGIASRQLRACDRDAERTERAFGGLHRPRGR